MATADSSARPVQAERLPLRMHHHAFVVADQERTRRFYEDILGLPLRATWIESTAYKGQKMEFSHTFYGLADGSALAFFNFADREVQARMYAGPQKNLCYHIALAVDEQTQAAIVQRCRRAGVEASVIDHGYCKSLYVTDPDGLQVEFTVDPPDVQAIEAYQREVARKSLDAWQAGDRRPNNNIRPHG